MSATCSGCGACCETVPMPWTQREMAEWRPAMCADDQATVDFAKLHWRQLTHRQALLRAPWLAKHPLTCTDPITHVVVRPVFYSCDVYDTKTKRCGAYDQRPPACRNYPWVGGNVTRNELPPDCSFRADQVSLFGVDGAQIA